MFYQQEQQEKVWINDEDTTTTAILNLILYSSFPEQPPNNELISDGDNDIILEMVIDTGNHDQYHMKWDNNFVGGISIDTRGKFPQTKSQIKQCNIIEFLTPK